MTLHPTRRLDIRRHYRLKVVGDGVTGVTGTNGMPLAGAGNGRPGTDFNAPIDRATLVLPKAPAKAAAHSKSARPAAHPHAEVAARHHAASARSAHARH